MNAAVSNLVVTLVLVQVARKLPLDQPEALWALRAAYIGSQLIQFGLFYYLSLKVKAKNDTTVLKYVEPKAPTSQDPASLVTTTNRDYDLAQISQAVRSSFMGIAMIAFMHLYMKYTQPLFLQSIMPLKGLFDNNEVKIHLLGKDPVGDLKRPFKAAASMFGGAPATDSAAIKEAEVNAGKVKKDL